MLFYDLFDLQTFKARLAAPADDWEPDWPAVEAAVQQLEAQLGPGEQYIRLGAPAAGLHATAQRGSCRGALR